MRERFKYALNSPSLVTELFKKKNRKCLISLVILTSIFIVVFPLTMVRAASIMDPMAEISADAKEYMQKKDPRRPDGKLARVTNQNNRTIIAGMAYVAVCPSVVYAFFDDMNVYSLNLETMPEQYDGQSSVTAAFTGGYANAAKLLIKNVSKEGGFISALSPIALAIVAIHFLLGMIELATSDRMTIEVWIKYWAKLIIAIAAIFYAPKIFDLIWQFSQAITSFVAEKFGAVTSNDMGISPLFKAYLNSFDDFNDGLGLIVLVIFGVFSFIQGILLLLLSTIINVVTLILVVTRVFELVIRGAFMPIGIAALADDGWHGSGGRYFKKLFALAIQGGVIILIIKATTFVRNGILAGMADGIGKMMSSGTMGGAIGGIFASIISPLLTTFVILAVSAAGIAAMFKSIQLSNDIVGA